jgi:hypothetical protein
VQQPKLTKCDQGIFWIYLIFLAGRLLKKMHFNARSLSDFSPASEPNCYSAGSRKFCSQFTEFQAMHFAGSGRNSPAVSGPPGSMKIIWKSVILTGPGKPAGRIKK